MWELVFLTFMFNFVRDKGRERYVGKSAEDPIRLKFKICGTEIQHLYHKMSLAWLIYDYNYWSEVLMLI
jgi:hypothetical protein